MEDIFIRGSHPNTETINLKAGSLSMICENGSLRYINNGKSEIVRMIYFALRDSKWQTIRPIITGFETDIRDNSFTIKYSCGFQEGEIDFAASFLIEGKSDNSVVFGFEGKARSTFQKNRIGLCLLHPVEKLAGKPCRITHPDGTAEGTEFPELISPHQLFTNIKSISWQMDGARYTADFYGDIFETEDQRNWTDASFKTYSTPLSLPFPVKVEKGTVISQRIEVKAENLAPVTKSPGKDILISLKPEQLKKLPAIGISRSSGSKSLSDAEIRILRMLHPDHYRVELYLFEDEWELIADQACHESGGLMAPLELALFFDDNAALQASGFFKWYERRVPEINIILIFHKSYGSTPDWLSKILIPMFKNKIPSCRTGTGTNANFVQLNREWPSDTGNDLLCYSIHPQEHASDNLTLVENLRGQSYTAETAAAFSGGKEIWISPVNIRRRFNANTGFYEIPAPDDLLPQQVDSRLMSLFGACWTMGSLKYLAESEVAGITYFETAGERGLIQGESDSRWPADFPAGRGMIFPVYFIFKYLLRNKSMKVIKSISTEPLKVESLVLTDGQQLRAMIANFTALSQTVIIDGCSGMLRMKALNEITFTEAVSNYLWTCDDRERMASSGKSFSIDPFSVTFIEGWLKH